MGLAHSPPRGVNDDCDGQTHILHMAPQRILPEASLQHSQSLGIHMGTSRLYSSYAPPKRSSSNLSS